MGGCGGAPPGAGGRAQQAPGGRAGGGGAGRRRCGWFAFWGRGRCFCGSLRPGRRGRRDDGAVVRDGDGHVDEGPRARVDVHRLGVVVLDGTKSTDHMREDLEVLEFELDEADVAAINGALS